MTHRPLTGVFSFVPIEKRLRSFSECGVEEVVNPVAQALVAWVIPQQSKNRPTHKGSGYRGILRHDILTGD